MLIRAVANILDVRLLTVRPVIEAMKKLGRKWMKSYYLPIACKQKENIIEINDVETMIIVCCCQEKLNGWTERRKKLRSVIRSETFHRQQNGNENMWHTFAWLFRFTIDCYDWYVRVNAIYWLAFKYFIVSFGAQFRFNKNSASGMWCALLPTTASCFSQTEIRMIVPLRIERTPDECLSFSRSGIISRDV